MILGSRNSFVVNSWRNPYITDGLIAMWDGEWNVGPGQHDPNATSWVDLTGKNQLVQSAGVLSFGDTYAYLDGASTLSVASSNTLFGPFPNLTIEILFMEMSTGGVFNFSTSPRGFWIYNKNYNYFNSASATFPLNQILHIAAQGAQMWKDGVKAKTATLGAGLGGDITLGFGMYAGNAECCIYALRVYSRVLTDSEMTSNYAVDKVRFNLP